MLGQADHGEIRALFAQVFGAPMSEALWRWKYDEGRGAAAGVHAPDGPPGALIAHYGGTRRELCLGREAIAGVQMGDVMVRTDARGILSRNGPFASVTRHFIAQQLGEAPRFAIGFGFPSGRHTRLGELLGLYRALGEIRELRWPTGPMTGLAGWRWRLEPVRLGKGAGGGEASVAGDGAVPGPGRTASDIARLDTHWRAMRAALPDWVLPRRDAAWCLHRYASHPHHRYRLNWLSCRLTRRTLGMLVVRPHDAAPGSPAGSASWEWMDWIGAPRHLPLALAAARAAAAAAGAGTLHGWFSAPLIERLIAAQGAAPTQVAVCSWCVTLQRASTVPDAIDTARWWLTSGDTDFR
jgi:hypothetical protein